MHNKKRLIKLTQDLIRIDSQNPPGNEKEIVFFIKKILERSGLSPRLVECGNNRYNVLAMLRSSRAGQTLLLTPHLDTVPFGKGWKFPPLSATRYKNKLYGRGATDCKANLAVGLELMRSLAEERIHLGYNILFAATADEEAGSYHGLIPLLKKKIIQADYSLILDADEFNIIVAQKGLLHLRIFITGKKAHGAYPERGINAIERATAFIEHLKALKFPHKKHPLLRPPTINVGTIHGGDKVNMVADWCTIELDIRYLPDMSKNVIIKTITTVLQSLCKGAHFRLEIIAEQEPCQIDRDHILVRSLKYASREIVGEVRLKGSEGATVMTILDEYGIPTVATGFGSQGCAHTTNEYVAVANLIKGYHLLRTFLLHFNTAVGARKKIDKGILRA